MKNLSMGLVLLLLAVGCGGIGRSMDVPLASVGGSGVSGTVHLESTICKSPCVTTTFNIVGGVDPRGVVRMGSCAVPGEMLGSYLSTDPTFSEPISYVGSLDDLTGKACVQVVEADDSRLLACGDIP